LGVTIIENWGPDLNCRREGGKSTMAPNTEEGKGGRDGLGARGKGTRDEGKNPPVLTKKEKNTQDKTSA